MIGNRRARTESWRSSANPEKDKQAENKKKEKNEFHTTGVQRAIGDDVEIMEGANWRENLAGQ